MRLLGVLGVWLACQALAAVSALPIDSSRRSGAQESLPEALWTRYALATLSLAVVALTVGGCLCCRRQRRPKGFQDDAGKLKEFKDGSTAATETTIERVPSASLELEVPRISSTLSSAGRVHPEALAVEKLGNDSRSAAKPKPPSPSLFSEDHESQRATLLREQPCREWFETGNCHVPREKLKYLREIGRGWFGKVVEGTTEIAEDASGKRSRGVVVRILTEEATSREKAWFLGEATPYLKLSHPNVLTLLGSCLEADPYLLLFESCPAGDLKGFLRGNRDKGTCDALRNENVPTRMALDIANALEHMHERGFAHTDLSTRNCLVAPDLSAKLGDYGTGVEKYPGDYYVLGDRALPIRWSAPESLECTETTIETRAITPRANIWSFGVLLWEISTWGERPYDELEDEQVIEMIFSLRSGLFKRDVSARLTNRLSDEFEASRNFGAAFEASCRFLPEDRASLASVKEILCGKSLQDFEKRWENLKPNSNNRERDNRSASLQDLRGSLDSELWRNQERQPNFRLGPEEPVMNAPLASNPNNPESGSETEEESWRGRVERGVYTEKVKQKSKSVADLMVLVHIDSDSEAELSIAPQLADKPQKKRPPGFGSDGDLRSHVLEDEFDQALRKLREPTPSAPRDFRTPAIPVDSVGSVGSVERVEKPKVITLTRQGETPILRLCFGAPEDGFQREDTSAKKTDQPEESPESRCAKSTRQRSQETEMCLEGQRAEGPVLRLLPKGHPEHPVLRYVPEGERNRPPNSERVEEFKIDSFLVFDTLDEEVACFSSNFQQVDSNEKEQLVDVEMWSNALEDELGRRERETEAHERIFEEVSDFSGEKCREKGESGTEEAKCLSSALDNAGKNHLRIGKEKDSVKEINSVSSTPVTPERNGLYSRTKENTSNLSAYSASAPVTPRKNYFSSEKAENVIGIPNCSSSTPALPSKGCVATANDEIATESLNYFSSTPSTPGKNDNSSVTSEHVSPNLKATSKNTNYSSSTPVTPTKTFLSSPNLKAPSKNSNYSSSTPATPTRSYQLSSPNLKNTSVNLDEDSSTCDLDLEALGTPLRGSAPDTPQSRGNYSVGNVEDDFSTGEELESAERIIKRSLQDVEDEDRKLLSTPDDERSSDSGFRDKESCEEEESPLPGLQSSGVLLSGAISASRLPCDSSPLSASAEEEQMRILFELDTILDAEYCASFHDSDKLDESEMLSPLSPQDRVFEADLVSSRNRSLSESLESTDSTEVVQTVKLKHQEVPKVGKELEDVGNFYGEPSESTEIDLLADSNSESTRTEKIDVESSQRNGNKDAQVELEDSGTRRDIESSEFEKLNESTEISVDLRLSDTQSLSKGKGTSSVESPLRSEERTSWSSDPKGSSEDKNTRSDATEKSANRDDFWECEDGKDALESKGKSDELEDSAEMENTSSCSPLKSEKCNRSEEIIENSIFIDNSSEGSPLKRSKSPRSSEILEASILEEDSPEGSPRKSNNSSKSSEMIEKSILLDNSPEASPVKLAKSTRSSEIPEASILEDNIREEYLLESNNSSKSSELIQKSIVIENSSEESPLKHSRSPRSSELLETSSDTANSSSNSPLKLERSSEVLEVSENDLENSPSDSPQKTDDRNVSTETRGPDSVHSDVEQWSSRENINENDNEDEDSSTMSLRSDNSYVSFGLDEEFVAAIRNELREKLPRAQMPVVEALDPRDEKEPSINKENESKRWEEEENEENSERGSGCVDIAIRYNIYGTPLSPILEERESAGTSESLMSKEDEASIASRVSALSEDVLVVDTRTNRAIILEAGDLPGNQEACFQQDDDRDTSHGDFSDEENLEYPQHNFNRGMESKRMCTGSGGAPLPSPEEETKWQQQFPLPLQMQDDLMSTSFGTDRDWDSQDEDEGEPEGEDGEDDEEENSSSSGEFVWKRYDDPHGDLENVATRSPPNKPKSLEPEPDLEEEDDEPEEEDEEEEEFTPSAWDATLAPHRSALRSPEKTVKSGDQKKSVWFKKQKYHCVYEYPKETPVAEGQGQAVTTWEPTSYTDWEEMMDEPRLDVYPMEYDDSHRPGDEEFYVSSSNRPFQFQSHEGKYVSQFFPGASSTLLQSQQPASPGPLIPENPLDEVDRGEAPGSPRQTNGNSKIHDSPESQQQQTQLGELRHTRDRLKLNLLTTSGSAKPDDDNFLDNRLEIDKNDFLESTAFEDLGNLSERDAAAVLDAGRNAERNAAVVLEADSSEKTAKAPRPTEMMFKEEPMEKLEETEVNLAVKEWEGFNEEQESMLNVEKPMDVEKPAVDYEKSILLDEKCKDVVDSGVNIVDASREDSGSKLKELEVAVVGRPREKATDVGESMKIDGNSINSAVKSVENNSEDSESIREKTEPTSLDNSSEQKVDETTCENSCVKNCGSLLPIVVPLEKKTDPEEPPEKTSHVEKSTKMEGNPAEPSLKNPEHALRGSASHDRPENPSGHSETVIEEKTVENIDSSSIGDQRSPLESSSRVVRVEESVDIPKFGENASGDSLEASRASLETFAESRDSKS